MELYLYSVYIWDLDFRGYLPSTDIVEIVKPQFQHFYGYG